MKIFFSIIRHILIAIGQPLARQVKLFYLLYYPCNKNLRKNLNEIFNRSSLKRGKIKILDNVRVNNIYVALWSHAGTVLAFALTIFSIVFSTIWTIYSVFDVEINNCINDYRKKLLLLFLILVVISIIIALIIPILLKRIVDNLPPESYAKLSLGNLNQSQILIFVAHKYWELCDNFESSIKFGNSISKLESARDNDEFTKIYENRGKDYWVDIFSKFNELTKKFQSENHVELHKAKALELEATRKLDILPTEFSHHVLKFSPNMLEFRLNNLVHNSETLLFLLKSDNFEGSRFYYEFTEVLSEVSSLIKDLSTKRKEYLIQLIAYDEIHSYLVGLASSTSTSRSLKIFARGLSTLITESKKNKYLEEAFLAFLYRSKAHYGLDLLISIENFYKKNFKGDPESNIPKLLNECKKNRQVKFSNNQRFLIEKMRSNLVDEYSQAMEKIIVKFKSEFLNFCRGKDPKGIKYIVIFGYSKIVKNTLSANHKILKKNNVKIFVLKEKNEEMLDTRILRFELDDSKDMRIRDTFTGTDSFFKRLLCKNDSVLMIAGAEAFDKSNNRLFHTNTYQDRVEDLISFLKDNHKKPTPEVWVVAGSYKIYESFPIPNNNARYTSGEFFVDHYDKVDIYNFNDLDVEVRLISEEG